jgi:ABC-type Fe3+ transport system permease subunit
MGIGARHLPEIFVRKRVDAKNRKLATRARRWAAKNQSRFLAIAAFVLIGALGICVAAAIIRSTDRFTSSEDSAG